MLRLPIALGAAVLVSAPCLAGPARVVEYRDADAPAPRDAAMFRHAMLVAQNDVRAALGEPPLVWNEKLAGSAAAYAGRMAHSGRFEHADQPVGGPSREGENLWTGTRDAYRYDEMVSHWVAERRDFVNRATPSSSRTGRWEDVGHYAQIVWRGTTQVGCALASDRADDYLVCRYYPAGNVVGEPAY